MRFIVAGIFATFLSIAACAISLALPLPASAGVYLAAASPAPFPAATLNAVVSLAAAPAPSEAVPSFAPMKPSALLIPNFAAATPTPAPTPEPEPEVKPEPAPEPRTLKKFLQIALQPVGSTMYIYGGGWNEDDTAAGTEALTIGLSPRWIEFAGKQDSTYNSKIHRYEIHNGLDCTGFIGWAVFNLMPNSAGYVFWSDGCAKSLSDYGLGSFTKRADVKVRQAGDIMSTEGHAWISLGEAADKSVVILHASPPGTALWGTQTGSKKSGAAKLADEYMAKYFPSWHAKYPQVAKTDKKYLTSYDQFKWDPSMLPDPDGYREMPVEDMLKSLFEGMEPKA